MRSAGLVGLLCLRMLAWADLLRPLFPAFAASLLFHVFVNNWSMSSTGDNCKACPSSGRSNVRLRLFSSPTSRHRIDMKFTDLTRMLTIGYNPLDKWCHSKDTRQQDMFPTRRYDIVLDISCIALGVPSVRPHIQSGMPNFFQISFSIIWCAEWVLMVDKNQWYIGSDTSMKCDRDSPHLEGNLMQAGGIWHEVSEWYGYFDIPCLPQLAWKENVCVKAGEA